jgi:hypothetical protein
MPFLGKQQAVGFTTTTKQDLTPDGSTVAFTLNKPAASANDIEVFVGNVRQEPTDAYTVVGTTLTMSAAPASGVNFYVLFKEANQSATVPAAGTSVPGDFDIQGNSEIAGQLDVGGNLNSTGGHAIISDYEQNGLAQNNHTSDNFNLHIADTLATTLSSTYQDDLVNNNIVHSASNVVIEDGQAHLTLLSSTGESTIEFADSRQSPGEMLGHIDYYGNTDRMDFAAANTVYLRIAHNSGSPKISTQNDAEFYSPSVAVAWYTLSADDGTIGADYNVTSVSNTGTGTYTAVYEITVTDPVAKVGMTTRNSKQTISTASGNSNLGSVVNTGSASSTFSNSEHALVVFGYRND